jgi:SAM-dependent methyltransferase
VPPDSGRYDSEPHNLDRGDPSRRAMRNEIRPGHSVSEGSLRMNINWEMKSLAFHYLDTFSLHKTLYFLQRNVTKRAKVNIEAGYKNWRVHQSNLATLERPKVFEFGAGKDLSQNIYLSRYVGAQTVVDLFPMLNIDLVNEAASQITNRYSFKAHETITCIADIERYYRVRYFAPFDATKTNFKDNAFDSCISTNTLEHIPVHTIVSIFRELRRIIRPGGLISAIIDYSDHYAHTDSNIGPLNFLQYSAEKFKKHNCNIHYQNRLRHYDYARIFEAMGYQCLRSEDSNIAPPPTWISPEFDQSEPSLCALSGVFLLRNPE